jgi:hypothetical protein
MREAHKRATRQEEGIMNQSESTLKRTTGILTATEEPPVKVTAAFEVEVEQIWIDYLTKYPDIFGPACGYWLRGIEHDEHGWLAWEDDEKHFRGREPDREAAIQAWKEGRQLPPYWFRIDRDAAIRAWIEGVKRWGKDWYNDVDAEREDVVVQLALLGEIRYG